MPKRVIDFDALWASDKLASCAEWAQSEYAWLYGLADASGSFEITNLRVIWGRVAAIRKNLTLERLQQIFDEFIARGLLFTWEENGKRYGHWTGSDMPGRLPAPSWRARLEKLAPPVPHEGLAAYSARFGGSKEGIVTRGGAGAPSRPPVPNHAQPSGLQRELEEHQAELRHGLEETQAQVWDLDLEKDSEKEVSQPQHVQGRHALGTPPAPEQTRLPSCARAFARAGGRSLGTPDALAEDNEAVVTPEALFEIYEEERMELPPAGAMTPERRLRCERCLAAGLTPEEFRAAVRRAAATPFLAGDGDRGWQASFDWLVANHSNVLKVLGGEYDPHPARLTSELPSRLRASSASSRRRRGQAVNLHPEKRAIADLYAGIGPRAADRGVRVNPAALERILARHAESESRGAQGQPVLTPDVTPIDEGTPLATPPVTRPSPPFALTCAGAQLNSLAAKPIACDAQARASPKALKF